MTLSPARRRSVGEIRSPALRAGAVGAAAAMVIAAGCGPRPSIRTGAIPTAGAGSRQAAQAGLEAKLRRLDSMPTVRKVRPSPDPVRPARVAAVPPGGVTAVGDSVMLDAAAGLERSVPGIVIDAVVNRQVEAGVEVVARMLANRQLGKSVVFALGTNGTFSQGSFARLVQLISGRHLVVVTAHCAHCSWVHGNNAMLRAACNQASHCTLADWYALAQDNPSWFVDAPDGVHMRSRGPGSAAYAAMVRRALTV